ncbi:MAG TPA: hypothetical protein PK668_21245 [Myxococcota bacterium]|nr:hypothetical protein [Myxococcota bacterium]HRY96002.1 hypothetical protein [Myxococcota bacterium]HSA22475.1 hypothetical protein [Myxococcota bacterium]
MKRALLGLVVLLACPAGAEDLPPVELPDLGESRLVLPWGEFKGLLERLLQPREPEGLPEGVPAFTLSSAAFRGQLEERPGAASARLELEIAIHVLQPRGWVLVPVFSQAVPLAEASLDGRPVAFRAGGDGSGLVLEARPGLHTLKLALYAEVDDAEGPSSITFPVPEVPVASLTFQVPRRDLAFELEPGGHVVSRAVGQGSEAYAVLAPGGDATLSWGERVVEERGGQATVEATVATLATVAEDALKCVSTVRYRIRRGTVRELGFQLPAGVTVTDVTGRGAQPFTSEAAGPLTRYRVTVGFEVRGDYELSVTYERSRKEEDRSEVLPALLVPEAVRQTTRIGVSAPSHMEVAPDEARVKGMRPIDVEELPPQVLQVSAQPVLFGMSSVRRDWELPLAVVAHEAGEVLAAQVTSARLDTLLTREGGAVTRALFWLVNSSRQFLRVELPTGAVLWSTQVGGLPVKPAQAEGGGAAVLVPLERARTGSARTLIEVTYHQALEPLGCLLGKARLAAPALDVDMSSALWVLHLPERYRYRGFDGEFEVPPAGEANALVAGYPFGPVPTSGGVDQGLALGAIGAVDQSGEDLQAEDRRKAPATKDAPTQMAAFAQRNAIDLDELRVQAKEQQGMARGVLPVRVDVDFRGVGVPAIRKLVRPGQAGGLGFWYTSDGLFQHLHRLAQLLAVLFALVVLSVAYRLGRTGQAGLTRGKWLVLGLTALGLLGLHLGVGMWVPSPVKAFGVAAVLYLAWLLLARRRRTLAGEGRAP